ncbi:WASH complex subunit 2C isoform X12 [Chelonia mydas]|uniref:WASH complex subunit 2C isoform X12 n=1 Tax=Chelonia mydas TaxID=8469 RepID=UPI001CA95282|nr:WASH complex subunit 2C isoform X12 [Chelonia mydas]
MERADPVWERAWALDEIRKGSQSWSLAADAGLLHFLQEFSQQTISRTHEIKKQVDGLIHETKATDCRLHNVFSDFLMLSNTQFIENRVYDEEVEEPIPKAEVGDKAEQEKTREQKEADLIPKIQEAVNYGLQVLDSAFEQLDIKAGNSDSEEEETNERVELILEPKDLYIDRPLPYLIGSQLFMERDDVGLGDFSSEEGSVDSDRGSVIDSEENNEERRTFVSDEEEEEDGCDLFGDSEKEEEDLEENTRPKKKRPTSFADELAARIKGDVPSKQDEEQSSLSAEIKTKKTVKEKKEVRVPSDDDEDDIFKPPKLTDEDFSPFGSKGGLFSGGMGLFDNEEESDLFAEAPRGEDLKEKELRAPINDEPSTNASRKVPAGAVSLFPGGNDVFSSASVLTEKENKKPVEQSAEKATKQPGKVSLFDDDDDFFVEPTNKHLKSVKATADFFDNDESDLFKKKPEVVPAAVSKVAEGRKESMGGKKSQPSSTEDSKPSSDILPKNQRGLFSDEEDSEDLFSSSLTGKSKSTSLPPSKSATKAPLSLFDDEDEEDLFGTAPAKKQQSKPPQEKAKQSEPLKKASGSLFSSDEEDHWNVSKPAKPISEDIRKGEPAKPVSAVDPAKVVKKTSLFEEDEEEEDLFAITKDSQRKHQKASLLFEEDAVNGGPLFSSQPTRLPSAAKATAEKTKLPPAPPSLFDEVQEKEDLLDTSKTKLVEEKSGHSEERRAVPVTGGTEAAGPQEKLEPFAASSLEPISNLDLFSASPPPLEKEAKTRTKNVLSLFEEEEEEKMEDQDVSKIERKEIRKPAEKSSHSKSTGVFQDEELLFSHKLQKDNDPDVDLFARSKKSGSAKLRMKLSSAGGLFGDDDEDDLFSIAKAKPPKVAEKKTVVKKDSSGPSAESNKGLQNTLSAKQDEGPKPETTEANLAINPAALLPSEVPKISSVKPALPNLETPLHEPDGVQSAETFSAVGNREEAGVSFDHPMQVDTLHSANKSRIKVMNKRRLPSRTARRLAAQESSENEELNSTEEPQLLLPKQSSALVDAKELCIAEPGAKGSTENITAAKLPSPTDGGSLSPGMAGSPSSKGTGQEDDLFGSDYLFVKNSVSKPAAKAKTSEILASKPLKGGEKKPALSVLDNQGSNDLFQPITQKASKKSSPISFLEDEDLFSSQKTARKKELKPTTQQDLDPKVQDIFEDDIFATEAIKPLNRTKESVLDSNLFDDNTDIFAALTVKPKEKKTKKKVESIFDDDMDDIFSSGSQAKASTPKGRSSQTASESKCESKASSTFDDPLNAFGGQ